MRMNRPLLAAAGIALSLVLGACGPNVTAADTNTPSDSSNTAQAANIAFAQLMIPHHAQAVEMADLALEHASSPTVRKLAARIKEAQAPEINQMSTWLTNWGAPKTMPTSDSSSMQGMDMGGMDMGGMISSGMMSDADMAALAKARGASFDRMWLQMMISHHQGAIDMANQVLGTTADAKVSALAKAIVKGQTTEVATMQAALAG
jgi:uncharacterized protein (DUF305 family)